MSHDCPLNTETVKLSYISCQIRSDILCQYSIGAQWITKLSLDHIKVSESQIRVICGYCQYKQSESQL